MNPPRLFFLSVVAAIGAVLGFETWFVWRGHSRAARALVAMERQQQELDWLAQQLPPASAESDRELSEARLAAQSRLDEVWTELRLPEAESGGGASETPLEVYFAIANLIEKARAQAESAGVILQGEECFGFFAYAHEAPAPETALMVNRQRVAVECVLEALFEAHPAALLDVRREPVSEAPEVGASGEDFFRLAPGLTLRVGGLVETLSVRLEFTGETGVLRDFLGRVSTLPGPVVVRQVNVEPLSRAGAADKATVPLIGGGLSKYAVAVELISWRGTSRGQP